YTFGLNRNPTAKRRLSQKKAVSPKAIRLSTSCICSIYYDKLFTSLVSFDLLLEALFLWMTFFLAKRSSMETTRGNNAFASVASVVLRNFLIALRVVFAW